MDFKYRNIEKLSNDELVLYKQELELYGVELSKTMNLGQTVFNAVIRELNNRASELAQDIQESQGKPDIITMKEVYETLNDDTIKTTIH